MKRSSALALVLIFVGALVFRLADLGVRPLHNDEAVNAFTVTDLWQHGRYRYDPNEYHGPMLHYATLPFLWLSGAHGTDELPDRDLRLAPVFFGAGLILLLFLFADELGWGGVVWAGMFLAISPAFVFYSRYFIHEILLVFFTALALGAGWRYTRTRKSAWAVVAGAAVGLMFATKETFVLTLAAMGVAGVVEAKRFWGGGALSRVEGTNSTVADRNVRAPGRHLALAVGAAVVVWVLLFSSFFSNWAGLGDSVRTYFPWLKRAAGASSHLHPWYFYFQRLGWFHPVKGPVWSEMLVVILAVVGGVIAFRRKAVLPRFLVVYTATLILIYSAISYKTPWCLLSFYFGIVLLAGFGAAAVVEAAPRRWGQVAIVLVLVAGSAQLALQSWRASFVYASDRRNPWVYAQAVPDILNLVRTAEGVARVSSNGFETVVKVIAPDGDYWPLPWYLRRFKNVGWYDKMPDDAYAPIIVVASSFDARLDEKSAHKWIMTGMNEMRPGKFFELYVEKELWTKYVRTLPPPTD